MTQYAPCDRCGKHEPVDLGGTQGSDWGAASDDPSKWSLRMGEMEVAPGLVCWVCHTCRFEWRSLTFGHELFIRYSEAMFALSHFRAAHNATGEKSLQVGLELLRKTDKIEGEINEFARRFMKIDEDFGQ